MGGKGEEQHTLYMLIDGAVVVHVDTADGSDEAGQGLIAPTFFGEGCIFGERVAPASFTAVSNLHILQVPCRDLNHVLTRFPGIKEEFRTIWQQRRDAGLISTPADPLPLSQSLRNTDSLQELIAGQQKHIFDRKHRLDRLEKDLQSAISLATLHMKANEEKDTKSIIEEGTQALADVRRQAM